MRKPLIFAALFFISGCACACGTDVQRESMAKRLYSDSDMQKFVCAKDSCSPREFRSGLQFHQYDEPYHGKTLSVCIIEPTLSATNSYTGVFASTGKGFEFQLISYGTGIKVGIDKAATPMISEYAPNDP